MKLFANAAALAFLGGVRLCAGNVYYLFGNNFARIINIKKCATEAAHEKCTVSIVAIRFTIPYLGMQK